MALDGRIALFGFRYSFHFDVRSSNDRHCSWQFHLPAAEKNQRQI